MAGIGQGLYVTELIGHGVNPVTGDYSRGASGFLIENGEIGPAVAAITIAGNLKDMFLNLKPASDIEFRRAVDVPTLRGEGLTVAGGRPGGRRAFTPRLRGGGPCRAAL